MVNVNTGPDLALAADAIANVYQTASSLLGDLCRRMQDVGAMWDIYHKQGLVPETDVFEKLQEEVNRHITELEKQDKYLRRRLSAFKVGESDDWLQAPDEWLDVERMFLKRVKNLLFDKVILFSEALTYLTQHISSRAGTLASSEATHGSNLTMHRFSGVQAVYDAAESLMADYASSLSTSPNHPYKGLVAFGHDYKAAAWNCGLTTFPLFAEHHNHIQMLAILAHEAAHWLQNEHPLRKLRAEVEKRLDYAITPGDKENPRGISLIPLLGQISVDAHARFQPTGSVLRRLAGEVVADIFATLVAGPAYPRILARYFLPIYVDSVVSSRQPINYDMNDFSWAFYQSSFKLRVATETARLAGYIDEKETIAILKYARLLEWLLTDIVVNCSTPQADETKTVLEAQVPKNPVLQAALRESLRIPPNAEFNDAKKTLDDLRDSVEALAHIVVWGDSPESDLLPHITTVFKECSEGNYIPYAPFKFNEPDSSSIPDDTDLRKKFTGNVSLETIMTVWKERLPENGEPRWRPRHLLSLLVPRFDEQDLHKSGLTQATQNTPDSHQSVHSSTSEVNRFAIILALAHHDYIMKRYPLIDVKREVITG